MFTESKLRDVESRLNSCESDTESRISQLQKQNSEYATTINQLNGQVGELDQQLADSDMSLNSLERKIAILNEDNIKLKEESSALRTQLISVKNSNVVLSEGLEQAISKAETYKNDIIRLEAQIDTTRVMHKERELKYDSTIAQQTKLIDFLQTKAEQPKKKSTFTDKIFGSHKKENQPSIPLAYRELESNLEKKTTQCRVLTEQLNKCKAELVALKTDSSSRSSKDLTKTPTAGNELMKCQMATPSIPHRALSRLTQSPGTQVIQICILDYCIVILKYEQSRFSNLHRQQVAPDWPASECIITSLIVCNHRWLCVPLIAQSVWILFILDVKFPFAKIVALLRTLNVLLICPALVDCQWAWLNISAAF